MSGCRERERRDRPLVGPLRHADQLAVARGGPGTLTRDDLGEVLLVQVDRVAVEQQRRALPRIASLARER